VKHRDDEPEPDQLGAPAFWTAPVRLFIAEDQRVRARPGETTQALAAVQRLQPSSPNFVSNRREVQASLDARAIDGVSTKVATKATPIFPCRKYFT